MVTGNIEGIGPRYCPSIEDKVVRFSERDSHQIFVDAILICYRRIFVDDIRIRYRHLLVDDIRICYRHIVVDDIRISSTRI
jgi:hypothetical protein